MIVGKRGRPPVLDDRKKDQIVTILGVGCSRRIAAKYVGCSVGTIRNTARRDPEFAEKLLAAAQEAEVGLLKNIRHAAEKEQYWRAAAWALERTFPDRYGRRSPRVITLEQATHAMRQLARMFAKSIKVARLRKSVVKSADRMIRALGRQEAKGDER